VLNIAAFAKDKKSFKFQQDYKMGAHDIAEYFGPLDALGTFNDSQRQWEFQDERYRKDFFKPHFDEQLSNLSTWWRDSVKNQLTCSNEKFYEIYPYMRYLFRLISMSYLYEGLKKFNLRSYQLGFSKKICSLTPTDLQLNCRGKSEDMKNFVQRARHYLTKNIDFSNFKKFKKEQRISWHKKLKNSFSQDRDRTIVQERLLAWCIDAGLNCKNTKFLNLKNAMTESCRVDKQLFFSLCSEKDQHYGLSQLNFLREVLEKSNVLLNINAGGQGQNCLRRYVQELSTREFFPPYIFPYFKRIFTALKLRGGRYLEGALFVPGALKEFDDKGLDNFLFTSQPLAKKTSPTIKPIKPIDTPIPVKKITIVAPTIKISKSKKKPPLKAVKKAIIVEKLSVFEQAVAQRKQQELKTFPLDMRAFKKDFIFTEKMLLALEGPLKIYKSRQGLTDMKKLDGLGQKSEPMTLFFLKYLLDRREHQSLWNIVSIIGQRFYVVNDIERKKKPVYIEIKNDATSKGQWQLSILKNDN